MDKNKAVLYIVMLLIVIAGILLYRSAQKTSQTTTSKDVMEKENEEDQIVATTGGEKEETEAEDEDKDEDKKVKEITVEGTSFSFSPKEIRVKKGDKVSIKFVNKQGFHDFTLDEFSASTKQIPADQSDTVEFLADKVGSFGYYCSVGNHRAQGMVGTLIVE